MELERAVSMLTEHKVKNMACTKEYVERLFKARGIQVSNAQSKLFDEFVTSERCHSDVTEINNLQQRIMQNWQSRARVNEIQDQAFSVPNATVGKSYEYIIHPDRLAWSDLRIVTFNNLEDLGLVFDPETLTIKGIPTKSGDLKIEMAFQLLGAGPDDPVNKKTVALIINADPKSLWRSIDSDRNDPFWKEDNAVDFQPLGDRKIVVASKRGRSHANVGGFRDDDFAFRHFADNGWSVVAVADGAGSAKLSREGSKIACSQVMHYFENDLKREEWGQFESLLRQFEHTNKSETAAPKLMVDEPEGIAVELSGEPFTQLSQELIQSELSKFIYIHLGNCARSVNNKLEEIAAQASYAMNEFHSTLIFTLIKKFEFGYAVLSFGVGDCPMALLPRDFADVHLMNWLDVGEFGGGTRFITSNEIFTSDKFSTRFGFKLIEDFSYLMLMTDGVYDPKFVVEANLEKPERWVEFMEDLQGANADGVAVQFTADNSNVGEQLSKWMDFWSSGNHDDRTLAVIF